MTLQASIQLRSGAALQHVSMLLVDDNPAMLEIVKTLLVSFGVERIHVARGVIAAFETVQNNSVDIAIVDYNLGYLSGLDFTRLIRTAEDSPNPFMPIIMLSAHSDMGRVGAARDAGVTEFCVKPVSAAALARKLDYVVLKPRSFVRAPGYFGPDRRRRSGEFHGVDRRKRDA